MSVLAQQSKLSVADYLAGEDGGEIRHEYLGGQLYPMAGASRRHGLITVNLGAFLRPLVRATDCQVFANDMKVRLRVAGDDVFYYPDILLTCDPADRETYFCTRPCLIVEVLSEQTERTDRREKFLAYTTLESLRGYVLVAQDTRRVELFRRENDWQPEIFSDGTMPLCCLEGELPLDAVYEAVL